jgi:HIRAN domain-containing protein
MTPVLFVAWQDPEDRAWYTVGRLTRVDGVFRFEYTKGATRSHRFIPFGRMQRLDQVYESADLFPLFANRLLAKGRPEYRNFLHWLDLRDSEDDPLALLARTGGMRETDSLMVFPCPEPTPNGEYRSKFFAQGLRYLPDYVISAVNEIAPQSRLFLMPDPQNEHDRLAIALRIGDPMVLVGYCPRYLTEDVHYLLRVAGPGKIKVHAARINSDAPIQLRLLCDLTSEWPSGFRPCSAEDFQVLTPSTSRLSRTALA